jgi:hypothetical protein
MISTPKTIPHTRDRKRVLLLSGSDEDCRKYFLKRKMIYKEARGTYFTFKTVVLI